METIEVRVSDLSQPAENIKTFKLKPIRLIRLPMFSPGSHIIVKINLKGNIEGIEFSKIFDEQLYHNSWEIEDKDYCYGSPIIPYTVNEGCYYSNMPADPHGKNGVPENKYLEIIKGLINGTQNTQKEEFTNFYEISLMDVIRHIMLYSCNYSIEVLTKYLAYKIKGEGNWKDGTMIIKNFIDSFYGENEIKIDDGSGLSYKNIVTTEFLSNFIYKIYKEDMDFIKLMPSPGNGTLKNRLFKYKDFQIYAKTGTLNGASFLSGISLKNGISFSIGINNSLKDEIVREKEIDNLFSSNLKSF